MSHSVANSDSVLELDRARNEDIKALANAAEVDFESAMVLRHYAWGILTDSKRREKSYSNGWKDIDTGNISQKARGVFIDYLNEGRDTLLAS